MRNLQSILVAIVVEPLVYFSFLFFNDTVITKTKGLVPAAEQSRPLLSSVDELPN
jgi:hypothetical protein